MSEIKVRIDSGTGASGLHLTIIDDASGMVILRIRLTHEQVGKLVMGYTSMDQFAAHVIDAKWAAYLGLKEHHFVRRFRYQDPSIIEALRNREDPPALDLWADTVRARCWAQSSDWSINNNRIVTFRMVRYENDLSDSQAALVQDCLNSFNAPEGLL